MNTSYAASNAIRNNTKNVSVGDRSFTVQTMAIPKGTPVTVGLAKGKVGLTQDFKSIIQAYQADAAINEDFF